MALDGMEDNDPDVVAIRAAWRDCSIPDGWHSIIKRYVKNRVQTKHDTECSERTTLHLFHSLHPRLQFASWLKFVSPSHPGTVTRIRLRANCCYLLDRVGARCSPLPLPPELRHCMLCQQREVESVSHFVSRCPYFVEQRAQCIEHLSDVIQQAQLGEHIRASVLESLQDDSLFLSAALGGNTLEALANDDRISAETVFNNICMAIWKRRDVVWKQICDPNDPWKLRPASALPPAAA
jgi:hypothetical protein